MSKIRTLRGLTALALLSLTALAAGCSSPAPDAHDHAHDEAPVLQETVWGSTHEVLIEHAGLVAGVPGHVLVHVTDLRTGRPLTEGSLEFRWQSPAGRIIDQTAAAPVHEGAWEIEATLPSADVYSLSITVPGSPETLIIPMVRIYANAEVAFHAEPSQPEDAISLLKEQQWRLGVRSEPILHDTFVHRVKVAATVEAPPERRVIVTTSVSGRVAPTAERAIPLLGEHVSAGEVLAVIQAPLSGDASDLAAAESEHVRTRQELSLAEAELARSKALVAADAAPARRVEEAEARLAAATAAHDAAHRLTVGDGLGPEMKLRSPIDGVVVAVATGLGEFVEAGGAVITILDPSLVWIRGWIPEASLISLPPSPEAILDIPGDPGDGGERIGRPIFLSPELDAQSRTASVVYAVDNRSGRLRVGQAVGLGLETIRREESVVVPSSALVDEHGYPVVFIQTGGETFIKRNVTLGGDDGQLCVVTEGVLAGERVVVNSAWAVKLAAAGTSAPAHGHTH